MTAYYNEIDPFAAAWLRELIKAGQIAPGVVDETDIWDVRPEDLAGFAQCHFFAGIGGWSYALRLAGWSDDRPVWTGSCPCQPFSAAGKRKGIADERHLWPALFHLISQCHPSTVFGEQVASKGGLAWFDTVSLDLENAGYTVGAADLCAAGFGAPHIRQRLYFVADSKRDGRHDGWRLHRRCDEMGLPARPEQPGSDGELANNNNTGLEGRQLSEACAAECLVGEGGVAGRMALTDEQQRNGGGNSGPGRRTEPSDGSFWGSCDWLPCIDGRTRPVEPGTFPLAHGAANRVGRLRGYGNAIVPQIAQEFIEAFMETQR